MDVSDFPTEVPSVGPPGFPICGVPFRLDKTKLPDNARENLKRGAVLTKLEEFGVPGPTLVESQNGRQIVNNRQNNVTMLPNSPGSPA